MFHGMDTGDIFLLGYFAGCAMSFLIQIFLFYVWRK